MWIRKVCRWPESTWQAGRYPGGTLERALFKSDESTKLWWCWFGPQPSFNAAASSWTCQMCCQSSKMQNPDRRETGERIYHHHYNHGLESEHLVNESFSHHICNPYLCFVLWETWSETKTAQRRRLRLPVQWPFHSSSYSEGQIHDNMLQPMMAVSKKRWAHAMLRGGNGSNSTLLAFERVMLRRPPKATRNLKVKPLKKDRHGII